MNNGQNGVNWINGVGGFATQYNDMNNLLDFDSSCNPPALFQNTFTFNDLAQSLEVKGLVNGDGFLAQSWWHLDCGGTSIPGVIFSLEAELWDETGAWADFEDNCHLDCDANRKRVRVAFGVDACYRGVLSITEGGAEIDQIQNTDVMLNDQWTDIGFKVFNDAGVATVAIFDVNDYSNTMQYMQLTLDGFQWTHDPQTNFHVGSFLGVSKFTEGRMWNLKIQDADFGFTQNALSAVSLTCAWNYYWEGSTSTCRECDWSCTRGCNDGNECHECHPTCKTCTGSTNPGRSDECTSCFCGAN